MSAAAGTSNSLLIALSQPAGLKGLEFDIESGQLGLVKKGSSKYPGLIPSKDAKVEHLVAIAAQVQSLVETEVASGNKSGLDLKRISKNMGKVSSNLGKRVIRDVSPSATFAGFLSDLFPKKESRLLKTFGQVNPAQLSTGERKRFDALQQVATRFIAINASIAQLTAPRRTLTAAEHLQGGTTVLSRLVRAATGTGGLAYDALIAKQADLPEGAVRDTVTAILSANEKGASTLETLLRDNVRRDISDAYTLKRNSAAAANVLTGTTAVIQALYSAETDPEIKAQLENLSLGLQLLDAAKARQESSPFQKAPQLSAAERAARVAAGQQLPETPSRASEAGGALMSQTWTGAAVRAAAYYVGSSILSAAYSSLTAEAVQSGASAVGSAIGYAIPGYETVTTFGPPIAAALAPNILQAYQNRQAIAAKAKEAVQAGAEGKPAGGAAGGTAIAVPPPHVALVGPPPAAAVMAAAPASGGAVAPTHQHPQDPREMATALARQQAQLDAAKEMGEEVALQRRLLALQAEAATIQGQLKPSTHEFPPTPLEDVLQTQGQRAPAAAPTAGAAAPATAAHPQSLTEKDQQTLEAVFGQ
ncbi:MAG: hypothetical protein P0S96_06995 [Simkaniaceae bacterium]|nr:hypothetical protein [Candidatus Sacchlamyda saccharinae]